MAGTLHSDEHRSLMHTLVLARKASGLSQAALAKRLGRPPSFVAKVELCERRLDVIEFCIWASAVSQDPLSLLETQIRTLPVQIPR
jgi:transcriptional regulator with XRE-family HTH domain